MSKSLKSLVTKPWVATAAVAIVSVIILARPLAHYADSQAAKALTHGNAQSDPAKALVWYKVAATLNPHDPQILDSLATSDIQNGSDEAALTATERAISHGGGSASYVLKSQALLELGQTEAAIQAAQTAVSTSVDQTAQVQLGLNHAATGDTGQLATTISLLGTSDAAQTLISVQHNQFTLAQALYGLGLLRSSQRALAKYQMVNSQSYLLEAEIALQLGHTDKNSLEEGRGLLAQAITLSPERVDLRQALEVIDQKLGDTKDSSEQGSMIQALEQGKV